MTVSAKQINKAFTHLNDEMKTIGEQSEVLEKAGNKIKPKDKVLFIKEVWKTFKVREELIKTMENVRRDWHAEKRKEASAEEKLDKLVEKRLFSMAAVADLLEESFEHFLNILNTHIAYNRAGFQAMDVQITNRKRLYKRTLFEINKPSYILLDAEGKKRLENAVETLRDMYAQLKDKTSTLDKLFAEYNNRLNQLFTQTWELDCVAAATRTKWTIFGRKRINPKAVKIEDVKAKDIDKHIKAGKIYITPSDMNKLKGMEITANKMKEVTVPAILRKKEDVHEYVRQIFVREKAIWQFLDRMQEKAENSPSIQKGFSEVKKAA